jgi:predicted tellurium resistance membrane protein TerC
LDLNADLTISYSVAVFIVVLLSASVLNLLKEHYIFQITGIAFLFIIGVIRMTLAVLDDTVVSLSQLYFTLLPILSAIAACLVSMSLGFWIFPIIRNKFKN